MVNPKLEKGDRVVLLNMEGETDMSFGLKGEVLSVSTHFGSSQYSVKWDNGRKLDLLEDGDKWMKEYEFEELVRNKRKQK
jgi:hypothetical protein